MIDWNKIDSNSLATIRLIVKRAVKLDPSINMMELDMDISATHILNPLNLDDLLLADDDNFYHDVYGISNHIDRDTGNLMDCFVPRYVA